MGDTQQTTDKSTATDSKSSEADEKREELQGTTADDATSGLRAERDRFKAESVQYKTQAEKAAEKAKHWDEYQASLEGKESEDAAQRSEDAEKADAVTRENTLLKLAVKHGMDEKQVEEISELLDGVPADQFGERAEKLAARLSTAERPKRPAPDLTTGRETPPGTDNAGGDFLRNALRRRR